MADASDDDEPLVPPPFDRVRWPIKRDDGTTEMIFEDELALAHLLICERVFLNDHWWEEEWPDEAKRQFSVHVNCNDVFAWGMADCEPLTYGELEDLWDHHVKDPNWGTSVWCIKKRGMLPQDPVLKRIQAAGIWDLTAMGLEPNPHSAALAAARAEREAAASKNEEGSSNAE